ncbi:stromal cell-derived factor 2-like [Nerophis lumbriciformis]|uniref:stromal cell-derived factor 2-like n=1 Tax=Nerophis lumbriciformis TaxID=546530 RepID=UPI002AE01F8D|nr:stromal cell-derived factor 2-like [Nerophis lumbriciformis]
MSEGNAPTLPANGDNFQVSSGVRTGQERGRFPGQHADVLHGRGCGGHFECFSIDIGSETELCCGDKKFQRLFCWETVIFERAQFNVRKQEPGSGQQSVTGVESADDGNSYWQIRGKPDHLCQRGTAIKCGQAIRFTHMKTGRNLHTHHFSSPLSNNQEVSAFGENGEGDDLDVWTVQCDGTYWERNDVVRFKHMGTNIFLSVTGEQYGHPIRGQREVHGMTSPSHHNWWRVMEGVFIQPSQDLRRHDEL